MSLLVAGAVAGVVFGLWYPSPFGALAGGTDLFLLLTGIDLVLGPLLTLVIASPLKPPRELGRDIAVIATLQLAALVYGLHVVASARPAVLALEVDVFRIVAANDIEAPSLAEAPPDLRSLSWTGPRLLTAVRPTTPAAQFEAAQLAIAGIPLAALPRYWRPYDGTAAWKQGRDADTLALQDPKLQALVDGLRRRQADPRAPIRLLPVLARRAEGSVAIGTDGSVLGVFEFVLPP